jgi:hypothetical protein
MLPTLLFIVIAYVLSDLYMVWSRRPARWLAGRHRDRNFECWLRTATGLGLAGLLFLTSWLPSGCSQEHPQLSEIVAGQTDGWSLTHAAPEWESPPIEISAGVKEPVYALLSPELNLAQIRPPKRRLIRPAHKHRLKKAGASRRSKPLAGARLARKDKAGTKKAVEKKKWRWLALHGD